MAIVDLGTFALNIGDNPVAYIPFPFDQTQGYGVAAVFTSTDFDGIVSIVRVRPQFIVPGQPPVFQSEPYDLEVRPGIQLMFVPGSALYRGNGNIEMVAERVSFWTGGGDGIPLTMQLIYDDAITTPTWR